MKLKLILWFFIFFSWYYSLTMEFLRYFWEQKITPKKQSWSPRHVEKMMHYTSQKIAPFQALISSKLHSVQSWHLFCQPKTVSFTNPQVHGPPNPLLYRELDCIQIVIWPAQAILDLFTDLHPKWAWGCPLVAGVWGEWWSFRSITNAHPSPLLEV